MSRLGKKQTPKGQPCNSGWYIPWNAFSCTIWYEEVEHGPHHPSRCAVAVAAVFGGTVHVFVNVAGVVVEALRILQGRCSHDNVRRRRRQSINVGTGHAN